MRRLLRKIGGPLEAHGVLSGEQYRRRAVQHLRQSGLKPELLERVERRDAYVSEGRWVVDCDCGNGPSASTSWKIAICFECGSLWNVVFPENIESIEKILLQRPVERRHFFPFSVAVRRGRRPDTAELLEFENRIYLDHEVE